MNVTGLAVVFGPNVFHIPTGAEGLEIQALANHTFERFVRFCDLFLFSLSEQSAVQCLMYFFFR